MLEFLKKLIERKQKEVSAIELRIKESDSADEVRELGDTLKTLRDEISEAEEQIAELEAQAEGNDGEGEGEEGNDGDAEGRSAFNPSEVNLRSIQRFVTGTPEQVEARSSMEYRMAFKEYIQTGKRSDVLQYEKRQDAAGTSSDLGVLIPTTVIQEIIQGVEGVYGQLYADVKKTNLPGGVKYPIGSFDAEFKRIAETAVSERQTGGGVTGSVEFSYKIGEVRLARTLLQTVLSVEVFEQEFAKVVVKAYVKAMDKEIMIGDDDNGECVGILTEAEAASSRIPADNIIEMTAADVADWTKWQEKVFAKIPLGMRKEKIKMVCTANTYEANLKTLKDDNNRPVYAETFNPVDGEEKCTFKGKEVTLVEEDVLENFNDASDGDYFGMLWVPEKAYGINSNLEFTVIDYFDHETNQAVKKAIVINDGKILDPEYIYLLKKDA